MKNTIYAAVIAACVLVAVVIFVVRRGGSGGVNDIPDTQMLWVKCTKCGQGYEMGERQYYRELEEKSKANPSPMPVAMPLTCQKCSKDGVVRAYKCERCSEVFRAGSVQGDFEDRCPKCKNSATEAKRKARMGQQ
ncbi:MAG: hypothetical protein MUC88_14395 [Planctomycetes bacterium]|jgi:DNA-directed RNA polymerase subunit RPC12/RpoP|nr:hypothetical protein [Planctomycetota bacterium]